MDDIGTIETRAGIMHPPLQPLQFDEGLVGQRPRLQRVLWERAYRTRPDVMVLPPLRQNSCWHEGPGRHWYGRRGPIRAQALVAVAGEAKASRDDRQDQQRLQEKGDGEERSVAQRRWNRARSGRPPSMREVRSGSECLGAHPVLLAR
jgi:hypothetical protein